MKKDMFVLFKQNTLNDRNKISKLTSLSFK